MSLLETILEVLWAKRLETIEGEIVCEGELKEYKESLEHFPNGSFKINRQETGYSHFVYFIQSSIVCKIKPLF